VSLNKPTANTSIASSSSYYVAQGLQSAITVVAICTSIMVPNAPRWLYPPERNPSKFLTIPTINIAMHALQPSQPSADGRHTKGSRNLARTTITPSHGVRAGEAAVVGCCCSDCSWCSAVLSSNPNSKSNTHRNLNLVYQQFTSINQQ
jgi:hypothetical protein